jgi:hypothetical protein
LICLINQRIILEVISIIFSAMWIRQTVYFTLGLFQLCNMDCRTGFATPSVTFFIVPTICVAGRGASNHAFPRRAWERENIISLLFREIRVAPFPKHHFLVPTLCVGMQARTLRVLQAFFSFPRSAWECRPGRSASCKTDKRGFYG